MKQVWLENKAEKTSQTIIVLERAAMRDLFFLLNNHKEQFSVSPHLLELHRILYRVYRNFGGEPLANIKTKIK